MSDNGRGTGPGASQGDVPSSLDSTVISGNKFTVRVGKKVVSVKYSYLKIIKTGDHYEVQNAALPFILDRQPKETISKEEKPERAKEYRKRNIKRTRDYIRRLAKGNFNPDYVKHVTLTFDDLKCVDFDNTDISDCNKVFSKFVKRLREIDHNFMFIKVAEFQRRGAVHYHVMCNLQFIPQVELQNLWGYGIVHINKSPADIAGYLSKYISKSLHDDRFKDKRAWSHSNNMRTSKVYYGKAALNILTGLQKDIKPYYQYDYQSEYNGIINASEYLDNEVPAQS